MFAVLVLGGCAAGSGAPISYGGNYGPPAPSPAEPSPQTSAPAGEAPAVHNAAAPHWADGEGTPLSAYALQPEQAQPFDPARLPRTHTVGPNEGLYDIATRYQVPVGALIAQNGLEPPYALAPGRVLELPPPRLHTVARGETFEDVAQRYNVDVRSLALLNRMQPPYDVRRGDRIVLPAMAQAPSVAQSATAPPQAGEQGTGRFAWPVRGVVVTRFGALPGGARSDGIEIAGREGEAVKAAADGDVVYAGADIEGLGDLVLIRHADNYVTAYAYNRRALVREGQRVRAGQSIAELGVRRDGRARLLFQVRLGREAVDPCGVLGAGC